MKLRILILCLIVICSCAYSDEMVYQHNVTIKRLGSHWGNTFYMNLEEGFTKPCKYGYAYCAADEPSCKSMLSIALTAQATGKKLPDFRYMYNADSNMCTVWLLSADPT